MIIQRKENYLTHILKIKSRYSTNPRKNCYQIEKNIKSYIVLFFKL